MTSNTFVNTYGDLNTMSLIDENIWLSRDENIWLSRHKTSLINKVN